MDADRQLRQLRGRRWTPRLASLLLTAGLLFIPGSCKKGDPDTEVTPPDKGDTTPPPTEAPDPWAASLDRETLRGHLEFMAADAQQGRAPGTDADRRVQQHLVTALQELGLEPAFENDSFLQAFEVTDGVRVAEGKSDMLAAGKRLVKHNLVPWGHSTIKDGPVMGRLIYVGYGIQGDELWTGDYAALKLRNRIGGRIVVALAGGPDDPHLDPAKIRPQTKLIAARDHGAGGFVLWEPDQQRPYPNSGRVTDLKIPAVTVGAEGTPALLRGFGIKKVPKPRKGKAPDPHFGIEIGTKSGWQGVLDTPVEPVKIQTANVSGVLRGDGSATKRIVIGAHMDHLGMGTSSSLAPDEHAVHNGADDNASGVATMIALIKAIATIPAAQRPYDIQVVAFGAEEMGLLGSKHMVKQLGGDKGAADSIATMLNFDMVGRMKDSTVIVAGAGTSSAWAGVLEKAAGGLTISTNKDGYGASDQTSFYEVGIPVLHFFSGTHADYHKPSDDIDLINFDGAAAIGALALRIVGAVMGAPEPPDYVKVKAKSPGGRGRFRVSLGTVPDYAAEVDGVKLSGVRAGGAAERAGLQKGDIIQKLGAREVHNMDDYMAAFATMKPNVELDVVVERDGKKVTLKMTPDAPRRR